MTQMTKLSRLLLTAALLGSAALPAMAQTGAGASVTTPPAAATGTVGVQRPAMAPSGTMAATPAPTSQAAKPITPAAPHASTAAPHATTAVPHAVTKAPTAGSTRTN